MQRSRHGPCGLAACLLLLSASGAWSACDLDSQVSAVQIHFLAGVDGWGPDTDFEIVIDGYPTRLTLGGVFNKTFDLVDPKPLSEVTVSADRCGYDAAEDHDRHSVSLDDTLCVGHVYLRFRRCWYVKVGSDPADIPVDLEIATAESTRASLPDRRTSFQTPSMFSREALIANFALEGDLSYCGEVSVSDLRQAEDQKIVLDADTVRGELEGKTESKIPGFAFWRILLGCKRDATPAPDITYELVEPCVYP